jgi:hypothetical protein
LNKESNADNELGFSPGDSFAIWEELAPFILNILCKLNEIDFTCWKGEKAYPLLLGVWK